MPVKFHIRWVIAAVLAAALGGAAAAPQQTRVVDRIVARVEGDIILQSQVRELAALQRLVEGRAESDDRLLAKLIEQWIVETEAAASNIPQPSPADADREMGRLTAQFATPAAFAQKLRELELSAVQVRRLLIRQLFLERYFDYRFRPVVQVEEAALDRYYQDELVPEIVRKNQPVPQRAAVEEQIRELLVQREISERAAQWLDETKQRLKVEILPSLPAAGPAERGAGSQ